MSASVFQLPAIKHRRWTWPDWPAGLYEDADNYHYDGDAMTRNVFDECSHAVKTDAPLLLDNLVADRTIDLAWPTMAGAVVAAWSSWEYAESKLDRRRWVELFRANGYTVDREHAARPHEPIALWRGCVPAFIGINTRGNLVGVDWRGLPADPYGEIVESWYTPCSMNWTCDFSAARRFARRGPVGYREFGQIFAAVVEPEHLLAQVGNDYIVDPAGLSVTALSAISRDSPSAAAVRR
ncbi:hypothetical protein [Mycobacterium conspicuum]|uniref:Uncharacterized protein n=1 Tax=Mycobacterium conspicuum TaxID=44010 RepID=A0A1X1T3V9_9MYCO|nr:hypothetical protein [Mycobacterium conspicuum]ORV39202.1 hypothetical protein AWC00_19045 [Mycobacterium conspicuum]BBZ39299.1 hypothetical protein MCNS_23620 [Mycobacterium conspicuum]